MTGHPAVRLLGIRHHGPGSARSVVKALDELQPSIVLVESPAETTTAFRWIGDDGLEPPVALLGYVVADPHRAVFAPLASFSPEWQAVLWANQHGVPVEAIDIPMANSLAPADDLYRWCQTPSVTPAVTLRLIRSVRWRRRLVNQMQNDGGTT